VEFRLLGPVEAWHGGAAVSLGRRRERCLLGILLLQPGLVVRADRLVDLLWDDDPPPTARTSLSANVSRLRTHLDPDGTGARGIRIVGRDGGYVAEVRPNLVDAHRFRDTMTRAMTLDDPAQRSALLRQALALWRGPVFAGVASDRLRERIGRELTDARLAAAELAVDADIEAGRVAEAVSELTALVREHPLRERLRAQLMLALYRSGRAAEALQVFRDTRQLLVTELGIEPGSELQRLHERILSRDAGLSGPQRPARAVAVRNDLPRDVADFTGRDLELHRVLDVLSREPGTPTTVTISAIDGMAGIGKTTLAVHAAHRLTTRCPDAALFLDLRAHTAGQEPVEPAAALDTLLRALGVPTDAIPAELDARAALWRAELATRRMVVVLDNAATAAQVRPLLPGAAGSVVIVTSRRRLTDLEAVQQVSLDVLPPSDAFDLFDRVAGAGHVLAEPDQVAEVVRLCGHLPLAIRIAAARLRSRPMWTVAHLAERLAEGQRRLGELVTGDRSVAAAFALSYERLTPDQQRLFRLLGLVPVQDFDAFLAAALTGTDPERAGQLLEDLVEMNLVQPKAAGRYRLHDLLREHATELSHTSESDDERRDGTGRALDYYLSACAGAMALVNPRGIQITIDLFGTQPTVPGFADVSAASSWMDIEYPNLVTVIGFAADHGWHEHAWQVAHVMQWFLRIRGHYAVWVDTNQVGLASARTLGDRFAEAEMLKKLGAAYLSLARYDEALEYQHQALAFYRATGDKKNEGDILGNLGITYKTLDRYDEALTCYEQALATCQVTRNRHLEAGTLQNLGNVYLLLGRSDDANARYRTALAIFTEIADHRGQVSCHINIGTVDERLGDYDEALHDYQRALDLLAKGGDRTLKAAVQINIGQVLGRLAQFTKAIDLQLEALATAREDGDRALECMGLSHLGETRHADGQLAEALDAYQQALAIATELGLHREQARAHGGIGAVTRTSDPRATREHWEQAIAIYDQLNLPEADQLRDQLSTMDAVDATEA